MSNENDATCGLRHNLERTASEIGRFVETLKAVDHGSQSQRRTTSATPVGRLFELAGSVSQDVLPAAIRCRHELRLCWSDLERLVGALEKLDECLPSPPPNS